MNRFKEIMRVFSVLLVFGVKSGHSFTLFNSTGNGTGLACDITNVVYGVHNITRPNEADEPGTTVYLDHGESLEVSCVNGTSSSDCTTTNAMTCYKTKLNLVKPCNVKGYCCDLTSVDFEEKGIRRPAFNRMSVGLSFVSCNQSFEYTHNCLSTQPLTCTIIGGKTELSSLTTCSKANNVCDIDSFNETILIWKPVSAPSNNAGNCVASGNTLNVMCKDGFFNANTRTDEFPIRCQSHGSFTGIVPCTEIPTCSLKDVPFANNNVIRPPVDRMRLGSLTVLCEEGTFSAACKSTQSLQCAGTGPILSTLVPCNSSGICTTDNLNFTTNNWKPIRDCQDCLTDREKIKIMCKDGFINPVTQSVNFTIQCQANQRTFKGNVACVSGCDLRNIDFLGENVNIPAEIFVKNKETITLSCEKGWGLGDCQEEQTAKCVYHSLKFNSCNAKAPCCFVDSQTLADMNIRTPNNGPLTIGKKAWVKCKDNYFTASCWKKQRVMCHYEPENGTAVLDEIWPCDCKAENSWVCHRHGCMNEHGHGGGPPAPWHRPGPNFGKHTHGGGPPAPWHRPGSNFGTHTHGGGPPAPWHGPRPNFGVHGPTKFGGHGPNFGGHGPNAPNDQGSSNDHGVDQHYPTDQDGPSDQEPTDQGGPTDQEPTDQGGPTDQEQPTNREPTDPMGSLQASLLAALNNRN